MVKIVVSTVKKVASIAWNIKPFILVMLGFYSMITSTVISNETETMKEMIDGHCGGDLSNFYGNQCWADFTRFSCHDLDEVSESVSKTVVDIFLAFALVNVGWMAYIIFGSGILKYKIDQVGYYVKWAEMRKETTYKIFAYLILIWTSGVFCYGFSELVGEETGALTTFLSGILQVYLGVFALYTPNPDTLKYDDHVLESPVNADLFTDAANTLERFQDAVLAACGHEFRFLKELSGKDQKACEQMLHGIRAIEFEPNTSILHRLCGNTFTTKSKETVAENAIEIAVVQKSDKNKNAFE